MNNTEDRYDVTDEVRDSINSLLENHLKEKPLTPTKVAGFLTDLKEFLGSLYKEGLLDRIVEVATIQEICDFFPCGYFLKRLRVQTDVRLIAPNLLGIYLQTFLLLPGYSIKLMVIRVNCAPYTPKLEEYNNAFSKILNHRSWWPVR